MHSHKTSYLGLTLFTQVLLQIHPTWKNFLQIIHDPESLEMKNKVSYVMPEGQQTIKHIHLDRKSG